jgi:hypothetical protein
LERIVGEGFVSSGAAVELPNKVETPREAEARCPVGAKRKTPNTIWNIRPSETFSDFTYPPEINARCLSCNGSFRTSNQTERISSVFRHAAVCGHAVETVPERVIREYEQARDEFKSKGNRIAQSKEQQRQKNESAKRSFLAALGA